MKGCFQTSEGEAVKLLMGNASFCNDGLTRPEQWRIFMSPIRRAQKLNLHGSSTAEGHVFVGLNEGKYLQTSTLEKVLVCNTVDLFRHGWMHTKWTISSNCPPTPQASPVLLFTVIFPAVHSSSRSSCSLHFTPTELIRGGGFSSLPAVHTHHLPQHTHTHTRRFHTRRSVFDHSG